MERVLEDEHRGPPRRDARDLHGILDRLGAGVDEDRALLLSPQGESSASRLQTSI